MNIPVTITLKNPTDRELPITIPVGAIFEAAKTDFGVQNVTIIQEHRFMLPAYSELRVKVTGRCLNRRRGVPNGTPGRLTTFRYAGPSFDQHQIWQRMAQPRRS